MYRETNSFNDFGSDYGGSVIDFYMAVYGITDNKTAIDELAILAGIENSDNTQFSITDRKPLAADKRSSLPAAGGRQRDHSPLGSMTEDEKLLYEKRLNAGADESGAIRDVKMKRLFNNIEVFDEFYSYCNKVGRDARVLNYLTLERKIPVEAVEGFKLFFIKDYHSTNNHLKKKFPLEQLQKSGLYNEKGNLIFYNHRIIIPYFHNNQGMYLRARYFDQDGNSKPDMNKYLGLANDGLNLNTPKRFFNSDVIKKLLPWERLFLVEGEFDCIVMQSVIKVNCIAVPGVGNLPPLNRLQELKEFEVVICPDGDAAGSKLVEKLSNIFKGMNKSFSIKQLPAKDPNEFIKQYC